LKHNTVLYYIRELDGKFDDENSMKKPFQTLGINFAMFN
jgi:hypothetical protein